MRHIHMIKILFGLTTEDTDTESNITNYRGMMLYLDSTECLISHRQVKHTVQKMFDILHWFEIMKLRSKRNTRHVCLTFWRLKSLTKCQFQFHSLVQSNLRRTIRAEGNLRRWNRFVIGLRNVREQGGDRKKKTMDSRIRSWTLLYKLSHDKKKIRCTGCQYYATKFKRGMLSKPRRPNEQNMRILFLRYYFHFSVQKCVYIYIYIKLTNYLHFYYIF